MNKPVRAKIVNSRNGKIRIQIWRSSDMTLVTQPLTLSPGEAEKFLKDFAREIAANGIQIEDLTGRRRKSIEQKTKHLLGGPKVDVSD